MASWLSQRQIVVPLISATKPYAKTARRSAVRDHRESGTPQRCGNSHASAFTATTTPGGKAGWAPAAGLLGEPREAPEAEALAPLADDLSRGVEASRDGVIGHPRGRQEHDLRADHVSIR
jgi:hypothetical protein